MANLFAFDFLCKHLPTASPAGHNRSTVRGHKFGVGPATSLQGLQAGGDIHAITYRRSFSALNSWNSTTREQFHNPKLHRRTQPARCRAILGSTA
jgi:hypothetical protein